MLVVGMTPQSKTGSAWLEASAFDVVMKIVSDIFSVEGVP